jgi:hypothetical protein
MATNDPRNRENSRSNPGLTPIDDRAETDRREGKHEPNRTTGRLPERAEKTPPRQEKKSPPPRKG